MTQTNQQYLTFISSSEIMKIQVNFLHKRPWLVFREYIDACRQSTLHKKDVLVMMQAHERNMLIKVFDLTAYYRILSLGNENIKLEFAMHDVNDLICLWKMPRESSVFSRASLTIETEARHLVSACEMVMWSSSRTGGFPAGTSISSHTKSTQTRTSNGFI